MIIFNTKDPEDNLITWRFDSIEALKEEWNSEDPIVPANDDVVTDLFINGMQYTGEDQMERIGTDTILFEDIFDIVDGKSTPRIIKMIDLGTFSVDVSLRENGRFDVYVYHGGCSGKSYEDVTADKIGELIAEDIECLAKGYQNEFSGIKKGDMVYTQRFLNVRIEEVFDTKEEAFAAGYNEPTYCQIEGYDVRGKSIGINRMIFAAYKE